MAAALERIISGDCEHRVLLANPEDSVFRTPCADCGKLIAIGDHMNKWGHVYLVGTSDSHPPLSPDHPQYTPKLNIFERFAEWLLP